MDNVCHRLPKLQQLQQKSNNIDYSVLKDKGSNTIRPMAIIQCTCKLLVNVQLILVFMKSSTSSSNEETKETTLS